MTIQLCEFLQGQLFSNFERWMYPDLWHLRYSWREKPAKGIGLLGGSLELEGYVDYGHRAMWHLLDESSRKYWNEIRASCEKKFDGT